LKFGLLWGKKAVTHFVTQFSHVSKHFGVYSRKQNKNVSVLKKNVLCVHKTTFRKKCINKEKKKKKKKKNN
jgi:hypothetical protein